MGYTTDFTGSISIDPPLNEEEIEYLKKFRGTRRMNCSQGPYYVDRGGDYGQDSNDKGIVSYNQPPLCQPSLWCQWIPTDNGESMVWDEGEKFYESVEWMQYLIDHFIGLSSAAKDELTFLMPHKLSGRIEAQGEEYGDRWVLVVEDNIASRVDQPRLGQNVTCPCCDEEFQLDA